MAGKWIPNEQTLGACMENVTVKLFKFNRCAYRCHFLCSFWFCCSGWFQIGWFHWTSHWKSTKIHFESLQSSKWQNKNKNTHPNVKDSLKDELLGKDGVLSLPWVCLGHLNTVQVDVTVGIGEILGWQLVGLLHVQHQAAHLRKHKHTYVGLSWAHTKLYLLYPIICIILEHPMHDSWQIIVQIVISPLHQDCLLYLFTYCWTWSPTAFHGLHKHTRWCHTHLSEPLVGGLLSGFPQVTAEGLKAFHPVLQIQSEHLKNVSCHQFLRTDDNSKMKNDISLWHIQIHY